MVEGIEFTTRVQELESLGVDILKTAYDPRISPDMAFREILYRFKSGGIEYLPLTQGEPRYRKLNSEQHSQEIILLEDVLNNILDSRGCPNPNRKHHFESLISVQHRIITPDETERWDFAMPSCREISKYLQLHRNHQ